jgi:hypothetical protein
VGYFKKPSELKAPGQWWPEARTKGGPMWLRNHPLMSYRSVPSWPPLWLWRAGNDTTNPKGEVGILKDVIPSTIEPYDRCFLVMQHRGAEYIGALLLSDTAFCREIFGVLVHNRGKPIQEIGSVNLRHTV